MHGVCFRFRLGALRARLGDETCKRVFVKKANYNFFDTAPAAPKFQQKVGEKTFEKKSSFTFAGQSDLSRRE